MMTTTVAQPSALPAVVRTMLIVEDDHLSAAALERFLAFQGFQSTVFHTGLAALSHVQTARAPTAAIVDIHLPDLSGLVLIQRLRDHLGPKVPIIVLSGDVSMATINSLSHVGATYFFSKPVNPIVLLERLEQLIA